MNENIKEFFNNIAINYVHDDSKLIEDLLDSLFLEKCPSILDLGCGKGIISEKLALRNKGEVVALDFSSEMIKYAKEKIKNPKVTFVNEDFYEFKSKPFDAIVCFDAYPHFMDVEGFVKKANELLKEDGLLAIIHDIGRESLNEHHKRSAGKVSRLLKAPEQECEPLLRYFKPIELGESDTYYKIVMIKR